MAVLNEYNELIREYFDISDKKTRKILVTLEDAEQNQVLAALSTALYDKIVEKVDDIDFGTIPRSRGDITKVEGFENSVECLKIIRNIVLEYKENPKIVDDVLSAIENVKTRKSIFMKAFALNVEFPMVIYNLIVMSIEQSISFLISVCIQYIKDPASQTLVSALDKVAYNNTRDNMLFEQLSNFNNACMTKEFNDSLNRIIKNGGKISEMVEEYNKSEKIYNNDSTDKCSSPFLNTDQVVCKDCGNLPCTCGKIPEDQVPINGSADEVDEPVYTEPVSEVLGTISGIIAAGKAIAIAGTVLTAASFGLKGIRYILKVIIPIIRNITYFFINSRVKLSDTLAIQAQFIEANAYKLQYSTTTNMDDNKKKKVVQKQLKIAEKLKNWSNKISIDNKTAQVNATKMIEDDSKQKTIDDLEDQLPPDVTDKGDLF